MAWTGGKGDGEGQEPPISLEKMLQLTAAANVNGQKFDGIDYFLFLCPHTNPEASDAELNKIADQIASYGFTVGSLVARFGQAPWDSAMGDSAARDKFLSAVKMACRIANIFEKHGVRKYGVIPNRFSRVRCGEMACGRKGQHVKDRRNVQRSSQDRGQSRFNDWLLKERSAGRHAQLEGHAQPARRVGMPESLGFQADLAHTYLYLLGL